MNGILLSDSIVATLSGSDFSGPVVATGGLTGSLQSLLGGQPYLVGGLGINIRTGSNGQIEISAPKDSHFSLSSYELPNSSLVFVRVDGERFLSSISKTNKLDEFHVS